MRTQANHPAANEARALGLKHGHVWSDGFVWNGREWVSKDAWARRKWRTGFPPGHVREDGMVSCGKSWVNQDEWARRRPSAKSAKEIGLKPGHVWHDGYTWNGWSWDSPEGSKRRALRNRIEGRSLRHSANIALCNARKRAREKGISIDLTVEDILPRFEKGVCEITGIPFEFGHKDGYSRNPYGPSLDRIDCKGGYTKGNVLVVLLQVNIARGEMPIGDFIAFCALVAGVNVSSTTAE